MPLSAAHKNAIDNADNITKAEMMGYIMGHDNSELMIELGRAMVKAYYPEHDPDELSNQHLALAILRSTNTFLREVYVAHNTGIDAARQALIDARNQAKTDIDPDFEIGDMPDPPTEPDPEEAP